MGPSDANATGATSPDATPGANATGATLTDATSGANATGATSPGTTPSSADAPDATPPDATSDANATGATSPDATPTNADAPDATPPDAAPALPPGPRDQTAPLALIAAGGTGGHMFPAQALAEMLLARGWRVTLSTDERGARYAGGFPEAVARQVVRSATTARGGALGRLTAPLRIAAGVLAARRAFGRDRPAVVVGFGGYPTIPALSAAQLMGLPRMIHEQNGVMGRVNRLFAPRVHRVACGTWPTDLGPGIEGLHTGNPVRAAVLARAGAPYDPPGQGALRVLVMGGSQGARVLSQVVPQAIATLPEDLRARLEVSHQARAEDAEAVARTYREAGIEALIRPFFEDVPERIAAAHLVVSRSGASSLADIAVIGRPAILIPFAAAAGDHQSANAQGPAEAGAAHVHPESVLDAESLARDIRAILTDPARAAAMARAALTQARPDAARRLTDLVEEISR